MEMLNSIKRRGYKCGFKLKKHSPEILAVAGVVGVVASAVMACKATTKLNDILEESKQDVDLIHEKTEDVDFCEKHEYTQEDSQKDLLIVYAQTGVKLVKLYAPSILLGTISLGCLLQSNNILRKRNVALAAAYATVDKGFKQYRGRVVERFGDTVDRELKYNIKAKEIEETVVGEDGNETVIKRTVNVVNPSDVKSEFARFFEKYTVDKDGKAILNPYWQSDNEYNLVFIKKQEAWANDLLHNRGYLYLNEVYDMLGLPPTKAGQIVGWVYSKDEENPIGDGFVDFGLYVDNLSYSDFVNGFDPAILLDFNVDGNIWDLM